MGEVVYAKLGDIKGTASYKADGIISTPAKGNNAQEETAVRKLTIKLNKSKSKVTNKLVVHLKRRSNSYIGEKRF